LFPSSFLFLFVFLCTCQYSLPSTYLLGTFDVYILYRQRMSIALQFA
jgi:hypothetical protein